MKFDERLEKAIQRGQRAGMARARAEAEKAVNEKELQRLHSQYRLQLNDHIEQCLTKLADHFPGFRFKTVVGEEGWGASIARDDVNVQRASGRQSFFSYLEAVVRPFSSYHVLELAAKATVRNKELFNRTQYQPLTEVDLSAFLKLVDAWAVEYAEIYAAKS